MIPSTSSDRILPERRDIPWLPAGAVLQSAIIKSLPPIELITSVFGVCFSGDELMMIEHETRKLDIPGGHIEPHENPETALRREFKEEAAAVISNLEVLGYIKITLSGPKPANYKYPYPVSYMVAYAGKIEKLEPFPADFETTGRRLLSPVEARKVAWVKDNLEFYELALRRALF